MTSRFHAAAAALVITGCSLGSALASADIAEVVTGEGDLMSFEYAGDKLRINPPDADGSYMLIRDAHMYVVTDNEGESMVFDMNSAFNMFGGMAASATPSEVEGRMVSLKPTGKTETLGGMSGEVYLLTYIDDDGRERSSEMVLSKDPRALGFRDAISAMARNIVKSIDQEKFKQQLDAGNDMQRELEKLDMGVLRYGEDMKVRSITETDVADARFVLPAEPTDLGAALGNMFGGGQSGGGQSGQSGGILGGLFGGGQAERQDAEAEQPAGEEADAQGEEAGDNALDNAFKKIFGN
ncbi:hypothetical protein E4634_19500 [Mangrovimicrobium sediminis]|uniref:DUF4412 domain-containing protein n=1 Tax=Mangrovimicrobium sediminis TaxID=2562682 RepID=A0A4Z0LVH1_9GAMM|nr:hypothetical protein [Haliea sp. SAOS-164]TGD71197.1 hypothetical protein E4634_19500 [Haliea sp. SAOS-164]